MKSLIDAALMTLLSSDSTLMGIVSGVYSTAAPDGASYPILVFHFLGGPDDYTLTKRIRSQFQYQIRVIDKGFSKVKINTALERVDVLLKDHELVTNNTLYCRRVGRIPDYPMMDKDGALLQQGGATYSIQVR